MASVPNSPANSTPWDHPQFLSEEGLRAAQEYYFQTHATHSQMVLQARQAQGMAKSFVRRKLSREMGEDFKMYTGTNIGQASAPEEMASLGIRGELNALLKHIYTRIAPQAPITSPIQEDLTILKHPQGALEVCYAMVFYYQSLMRQYASFASNRRKVLKSIMDEELFKWIWRTSIGFMMAAEDQKLTGDTVHLCSGLAFVPSEKQRVPLGAKLYEVGMFLLSKTLQESHLRIPLCFYFLVYIRQAQTVFALRTGRRELDDIYSLLTRRVEGEPVEDPLVAVDVLLNGRGSSTETFDEVMTAGGDLTQHIPAEELQFISQFEDFSNPDRIKETLRKLVPDLRRDSVEGQDTSLMPLLLSLRVMPGELREAALARLPIPLLNMLRNRIANAHADVLSEDLADAIRAAMDARKSGGGGTQTVVGTTVKGAVAQSVRVAPPAGSSAKTTPVPAAGKPQPQRAAQPTAKQPAAAAPAVSQPRAGQAAPAAAQSATPQPVEPRQKSGASYLEEPAVLAWKLDGAKLMLICLSAEELFELVGGDTKFLVPWTVFSLRTGQVFGLSPDRVSKERVEQVVQALRRQAGSEAGSLPADARATLVQQGEGGSHVKLLLALIRTAGLQRFVRTPPHWAPALASLSNVFGDQLMTFLRNPSDAAFQIQREALSPEERQALVMLQRVARSQ